MPQPAENPSIEHDELMDVLSVLAATGQPTPAVQTAAVETGVPRHSPYEVESAAPVARSAGHDLIDHAPPTVRLGTPAEIEMDAGGPPAGASPGSQDSASVSPHPARPSPAGGEPPRQAESLIPDEALAEVLAEIDTMTVSSAVPGPSSQSSDDASAAAPAGTTAKKHRFVVGKKAPPSAPEPGSKPEEPALRLEPIQLSAEGIAIPPAPSLAKRFSRYCEFGLELLDKPFQFISAAAKKWIGTISLATIATCLAWVGLRGMILPYRDAITFVREKRHKMDHPPAATEAAHTEQKGGGHGDGAKSETQQSNGHSAAKDDAHPAKKTDAKKASGH